MKAGIHPEYKENDGDLQLRELLRYALDAGP